MSGWRSVKAKQPLAALLRIGWTVAWQNGSHRRLRRPGWANYTFAFHDGDEVGPGLLARSRRKPGCNLRPYRLAGAKARSSSDLGPCPEVQGPARRLHV